ncbi:hypothetical protein [Streptomyces erythrochromogenes]|uniref:hypothetical protein n=1 Tax=Streptomyces erythrochromogenes TaxID=285574 RepID=UPI00131CAB10|nr:hypothetical protein [Streptomyces erythrochromogenes]
MLDQGIRIDGYTVRTLVVELLCDVVQPVSSTVVGQLGVGQSAYCVASALAAPVRSVTYNPGAQAPYDPAVVAHALKEAAAAFE